MRKEPTDNYINIALLGNNAYDIIFMNYLFTIQNVNSYYCNKYIIIDAEKENILKNIAYYFGTRGPVLIDDKGLRKIFDINEIPKTSSLPNLTSEDIINYIDICLKSDAIYVCNTNGELDKYTMFILGYLMAKEQEIFFWNDINETEWLMSCISKKNNKGNKEVVQFPLEIIRTLAYPYLFKQKKLKMQTGKYAGIIVDNKGNIGVERNTEFNLQVETKEIQQNTITLLGSLRKQLISIKEMALQLEEDGYRVLAPKLSDVKTDENGFVIFEDDISDNPIIIETDFIEKCLRSERIIVCDKDGYVGNTVMFEIGYLLAKNKKIEFIKEPNDRWLEGVVNFFSELNVEELKKIIK